MNFISDNENLPPVRLSIQNQFATHEHESIGEILSLIRGNIARQLAEKIVRESKFFDLKIDKGYGTMRSDIIVLTQEEYAAVMRAQFKKGVEHARGLMPSYF